MTKKVLKIISLILVALFALMNVACGECDHVWKETSRVESTCAKKGEIKYVCELCGGEKIDSIAKIDHEYETIWRHDEDEHWHYASCGCGPIKGDVGAHEWGEPELMRAPKCDEEGVYAYECECGEVKFVNVPKDATKHTYAQEWSWDDDCHWIANTCNCGVEAFKNYDIHDWSEPILVDEANCNTVGKYKYECSCGAIRYDYTSKDESRHGYSSKWSTNEEFHWREKTCDCDIDQYTAYGRHHWDDNYQIIKDSTCIATGEGVFYCVCGESKADVIAIDPNNHNPEAVEIDGETVIRCKDCGAWIEESTGPDVPIN